MNLYGFVRNDSENWVDFLGYGVTDAAIGAGKSVYGGLAWLSGLGAMGGGRFSGVNRIGWENFDSGGSSREQIANVWIKNNKPIIRDKCDLLAPGHDDSFTLFGPVESAAGSEIAWISLYKIRAYGHNPSGNNVEIEKYLTPLGRCICGVYAEIEITASDDSNFNPGGTFGPWDLVKDDWFIALRDNTIFGHDYVITASEQRQLIWTEEEF